MERITPNDLESFKGTDQPWDGKVALYPSLKKLEEHPKDFTESHDGREGRMLQFIKNHRDLESMKGNPERIIEAMDEYANQHEFMIHVGSDKALIIQNLILENKPRTLVELGGYCGYSSIIFAEQMRRQASDARSVHVWSIEKEEDFATIARDLISLAGLQEYVTVVTGASDKTLRKLSEDGKIEQIDLLFLDHAEDLYLQDLRLAMDELKLLRENSCVVADNVLRPGAPEYREYVENHKRFRSRTLKAKIMPGEFEDEIEISKLLPAEENQETEDERRGVGMGVI